MHPCPNVKTLKPGDVVTLPATQRGEPPLVTLTVEAVTAVRVENVTEGVRVVYTNGRTIIYVV